MTFVQVLRIQEVCTALKLLLLLLPLPLLHASSCLTTVQTMDVANTADAEKLAEDLLCDGSGSFAVSWYGDIMLSRTISVSNGSTLNITGSSGGTGGAFAISDGTLLLFQVDLGSIVSLADLTLSGEDGALEVAGGSFIEMVGCNFMHNRRASKDGGAVHVDGSSIVLKGETVFVNNTASYGGAIYIADSSELTVTEGASVYFINNHAGINGGAICLNDDSIFNSYGTASFVSNMAEYGGAIASDNSQANLIGIVSFEDNHAATGGGAVYVDDGSRVVFEGEVVFAYNNARYGGAVYLNEGSNASFGRDKEENGGAIASDDSQANIIGNVSFEDNHANTSGGAVYVDGRSSVSFEGEAGFAYNTATYGGGVYVDDGSSVSFEGEAVFAYNTAKYGGSIFIYEKSVFKSYGAASFVSNEAVNGGAVYLNEGSNASFKGDKEQTGGAIASDDSRVNPIGNASFEDNHADASGGAVYADGGSNVYFEGEAGFAYNTATYGGAVYADNGSSVSFEGGEAVFAYNTAKYGGSTLIYDQSVFKSYGTASFVSNEAKYGGLTRNGRASIH